MAVDSQAKRFAMLGFVSAVVKKLFVVDTTVTTEDRLAVLGLYNGFALDAPVATTAYDPRSRLRQQRDIITFVMGGA